MDEEQAQSAVNFATTVELLKKQEAQKLSLKEIDLTNVESITAALPKYALLSLLLVSEHERLFSSRKSLSRV